MTKKLIGYPVIIHDQVGNDWFGTFFGIATNYEDGYFLDNDYKGKISAIKTSSSFGQSQCIEVLHGIHHYDNRISAAFWIYPDEYEKILPEFKESWDKENYQMLLDCLSHLGITQ